MDDFDEDYFWMSFNYTDSSFDEHLNENEEKAILSQGKYLIGCGIFLILMSFVGNIFVFCRIVMNPQLRKDHLLFLNLSLTDILTTFAVHLFMVISIWNEFIWIAGNVFCKIFIVVQVLTETASIFAVLSIVTDQFLVLVKPPCPSIPKMAGILGSWFVALLPALPHLYSAGQVQVTDSHQTCISIGNLNLDFSNYLIYLTLVFTLYFYIPIFAGTVMYIVILLVAKPRNWFMTSSDKSKMFLLSLMLFGIAVLTSMPFVIEHNIFSHSQFLVSTIEIDSWLYFVFLSRNTINPYVYIAFHLKGIIPGRGPGQVDAVPLVTPHAGNTSSNSTQLTQEALHVDVVRFG